MKIGVFGTMRIDSLIETLIRLEIVIDVFVDFDWVNKEPRLVIKDR